MSRARLVLALVLLAAMAGLIAGPAHGSALSDAVKFLRKHQNRDGGFAERRGRSDPSLTGWAVLGLAAAGQVPAGAARYLQGKSDPAVTDLELRILALDALGRDVGSLARRLEFFRKRSGAIGPAINSTIWGVLALRAADRPATASTLRFLVRNQWSNGGWGWQKGVVPDSNDTSAAVQALRAAGFSSRHRSVRRGIAFIRRHQNADGGYSLYRGGPSDAQSTAWAIQALIAAGQSPGRRAFAYLERLQRPDGSFRYTAKRVSAPVWTTAQVAAALARRPFPVR